MTTTQKEVEVAAVAVVDIRTRIVTSPQMIEDAMFANIRIIFGINAPMSIGMSIARFKLLVMSVNPTVRTS
jgi:hypothetical protein